MLQRTSFAVIANGSEAICPWILPGQWKKKLLSLPGSDQQNGRKTTERRDSTLAPPRPYGWGVMVASAPLSMVNSTSLKTV